MVDLNNIEEIKKLDPKDVFGSTELLEEQCRQIWEDVQKVTYSDEYKITKNIVICGMGGSAYGGHVIAPLFKHELPVPVQVVSDYKLPAYVDQYSLVILTSYSGSTEETIECAKEALEKGAKITGLTTGGRLGEFLQNSNIPTVIIDPKNNPSGQPRLGTGYIIMGTIGILNTIGILRISDLTVDDVITELSESKKKIKARGMEIAKQIHGKIPLIMASDFLTGNAHIIRNQLNETSKNFSAFSALPELNHHLMEGLKNPPDNKLAAIILNSDFYSDEIKKRIALTKDVITKNNIPVIEYQPEGNEMLSQMLNVLLLGGYITFYLAILYGIDPSQIPWVNYFKEMMVKVS